MHVQDDDVAIAVGEEEEISDVSVGFPEHRGIGVIRGDQLHGIVRGQDETDRRRGGGALPREDGHDVLPVNGAWCCALRLNVVREPAIVTLHSEERTARKENDECHTLSAHENLNSAAYGCEARTTQKSPRCVTCY